MPRDATISRTYESERRAFVGLGMWEQAAEFPNVAAVQRYVDRVVSYQWFKRRWPSVNFVRVRWQKRGRTSRAGVRTIWMCRAHWNRYILAHELAHVCAKDEIRRAARDGVNKKIQAHGREFRRAYVQLVDFMIGRDAGKKLRAEFKRSNLSYSAPKTITPERRRQLEAQAAMMRRRREAACKSNPPSSSPTTSATSGSD